MAYSKTACLFNSRYKRGCHIDFMSSCGRCYSDMFSGHWFMCYKCLVSIFQKCWIGLYQSGPGVSHQGLFNVVLLYIVLFCVHKLKLLLNAKSFSICVAFHEKAWGNVGFTVDMVSVRGGSHSDMWVFSGLVEMFPAVSLWNCNITKHQPHNDRQPRRAKNVMLEKLTLKLTLVSCMSHF